MANELKDLALRLENLEKQVETVARRPSAQDLSAEDLKAYVKVQEVLMGTCGINETSPCIVTCRICQLCTVCQTCYVCRVCNVCQVCQVCQVCRICDVECTSGPCTVSPGTFGGAGRFGGLGGG